MKPKSSCRILVVEDEEPMRRMMVSALQQEGYWVLAAQDPSEAAQLHGTALFGIDLLVTDVMMPEMSGDEFAKEMIGMRSGMKVLFVTGSVPSSSLPSEPGKWELLRKPFGLADLLDRVGRMF